MKYPIKNILIGNRQRQDMGDIAELADSLRRLGQIHSIGVDDTGLLIWGMRRYLAASSLGWEEIEATVRSGLTVSDAQEIELEEDIRRKDRTWQEECIAVAKLFTIKARQARAAGQTFGIRDMASYTGFGKSFVADYVFTIGAVLAKEPKDEEVWACATYSEALDKIRDRREKEAYQEMVSRREQGTKALEAPVPVPAPTTAAAIATVTGSKLPTTVKDAIAGLVQPADTTAPAAPVPMKRLSLRERAMLYSQSFAHLGPPNTPLFYINKDGREFIHGFWFVGGGNISSFYGSYQIEYLKRINSLFPDIKGKQEIVHLFSGSIPLCDDYTVVGLPDNDGHKPDIECDAEKLSSGLPFQPSLIFADPPYSIEDSEHYANAMVNRERVMSECAVVLKNGGYLVWIDQALPIFSNNELQLVGAIAYVRSTGNRFRVVTIFQKPTPK